MHYLIKCIVRGSQARVKNADLRHPSCTVVMYRRKSASPIHNVLRRYFNSSVLSVIQYLCLMSSFDSANYNFQM
jgi:hypothetical protein